jgi:DNA-binding MarR family transcriptional regulator
VSGVRRARRAETGNKQKLRLWLHLLRVARGIEVELRRRLAAEFATTLPKFDVMAALARADTGMNMTELSRHLMVSNGNVTGIIDRLVAERMVERLAQVADRRATFVRLTDKGSARFAAMAEAHADWVGAILAIYSSAEVATLLALLARARPRAREGKNGYQPEVESDRGGLATTTPPRQRRVDDDAPRLGRRRGSGGSHVR